MPYKDTRPCPVPIPELKRIRFTCCLVTSDDYTLNVNSIL